MAIKFEARGKEPAKTALNGHVYEEKERAPNPIDETAPSLSKPTRPDKKGRRVGGR